MAHMDKERGRPPQLLQAVMDINTDQRRHIVNKVLELNGGSLKGKQVGILGLAFKPNTDDMRDAPSIDVIAMLEQEGARVQAYDPVAMTVAHQIMPTLQLAEGPYEAAGGCDALIILTEWNEFKQLDFQRLKALMKSPVLIDARNIYEPDVMQELGFSYRGVGRGYNNH